MKLTQWIRIFFGVLLGCTVLFMAYNIVTDPFGVFGDRFFHWYEYDMTMNPRAAKIDYLDRNHRNYDSYVVGSSKASSLPVEELDRYLNARFYNMTWYGGDLRDECQLVHYLIGHYTVKNIVLTVDPQNAEVYNIEEDPIKNRMHCHVTGESPLTFYGRYLLCNPSYGMDKIRAYRERGYLTDQNAVYIAETGCYNKQKRDATPIGSTEEYLQLENNIFYQEPKTLPYIEEALDEIRDIMETCRENGVSLTIIGIPVNNDEFYSYDQSQLETFWRGLAELAPFYDFWGNNSINGDIRYYYDTNHFRNDVGRMVLARIFGDGSRYLPEDFGRLTDPDTVSARISETFGNREPVPAEVYVNKIPILVYHSFTFDQEPEQETEVSADRFREQIRALAEAGYHAVSFDDLRGYVEEGRALPDKPVVLTFDDGYQSNLDIAAPVLEEYGFQATISVIGCSVGKDVYKDTDHPMTPHFPLEAAEGYVRSGVIDIQSHSYDMHQVRELDGEDCRQGVLRMEGESESAYVEALTEDYLKSKQQIESALPVNCHVYTYPYGYLDLLSEVVLHGLGVDVTLTVNEGVNEVIKGLPQSLYQLKRINVGSWMTARDLLAVLAANG